MSGQYITRQGNVIQPEKLHEKEIIVIPHIVNNIGVMGGGVALALKNKWPVVYQSYKEAESNPGLKLGEIHWASIPNENIVVINMIAQEGIVRDNNPKPIKYVALMDCMLRLMYRIKDLRDRDVINTIHAPKFGSFRAGGNWDFIEELIKEIWVDNNIDVVIYEYKE